MGGSGFQIIKFDFVKGGQEIRIFILLNVEFFLAVFCLLSLYFLSFTTFHLCVSVSLFQDNKARLKQALPPWQPNITLQILVFDKCYLI